MTMEGLGPVRTTGRNLDWMDYALCAQTNPDGFTPEQGGSTKSERETCARCEVPGNCLEYAFERGFDTGFYGGKSAKERKAIQKKGQEAVDIAVAALRRRAA